MPRQEDERQQIERSIERAREGVSEKIDELDRRLRTTLDVKSFASEHATQLAIGGAVVGFLAGFGFPKLLRRVVQIGVPVALAAWKLQQSRNGADDTTPPSPS